MSLYRYLALLICFMVMKYKSMMAVGDPDCGLSDTDKPFSSVSVDTKEETGEVTFELDLDEDKTYVMDFFACDYAAAGKSTASCSWNHMILESTEKPNKDNDKWVAKAKFPPIFDCNECLLQWKIKEASDNYVGCKEMSFEGSGFFVEDLTTTTTKEPTTKPSYLCFGVSPYDKVPGIEKWCEVQCNKGSCPVSHCNCKDKAGNNNNAVESECKAVTAYASLPGMNAWCKSTCANGHCPPTHCTCAKDSLLQCKVSPLYARIPTMKDWCLSNCRMGNCKNAICTCGYSLPA
ncbi:hypothetical protein Ahia01_000648500 [Argonauta hians]